jgi:chromosome segregation ATPase
MLQLRHIRLRSFTKDMPFGADLPLEDGLNILQAKNTSGKSTVLQAIIYALGLERSLGPQLQVPLPYAMREQIHSKRNQDYEQVIQSYVELELVNSKGETLTVHRDIQGGEVDRKLIRTWNAPILSTNAKGVQRDFYIHDGGAAQREGGFHRHLTDFIGWNLPVVQQYDGTEVPLYLETIFPMFFVEQKKGWSAIQGPFPTFFRIQDVARRVIEFLLDLEAGKIRRERVELQNSLSSVQKHWNDRRMDLERKIGALIKLEGIPATPDAEFAHIQNPVIKILYEGEWETVENSLLKINQRIKELESVDIPETEAVAPEMERKLNTEKNRVSELSSLLEVIRQEYNNQLQDLEAINSRIESLETDLKRNQDTAKLKKLGSVLGSAVNEQLCPTCHQDVDKELLPTVSQVGMGLEENISFVKSQLALYNSSLANSKNNLADLRRRYDIVNSALAEARKAIRTYRDSLLQPSSSPSRAIIEEQVNLRAKYSQIQSVQESVYEVLDELKAIAQKWCELQDRLKLLKGQDLTASDQAKISNLEQNVQFLLSQYGFTSFNPNTVVLSQDNFHPLVHTYEDNGYVIERELRFETSASDYTRLKWAYYLAFLVVSQRMRTNHPGLLVFDEPGQQAVDITSLSAFLAWTAENLTEGQQVFIATSEPLSSVQTILNGRKANIVSFEDLILQPIG